MVAAGVVVATGVVAATGPVVAAPVAAGVVAAGVVAAGVVAAGVVAAARDVEAAGVVVGLAWEPLTLMMNGPGKHHTLLHILP